MNSESQRWETGSQTDAIRNGFVMPVLAALIAEKRPAKILDVGAGTGYVARCVDAMLNYRARWTLIDQNLERLRLAETLCPERMEVECLAANVFDWPWEVGTFDAVLVTFTLLEIEDVDRLCRLIAEHMENAGTLLITMPDAWADVLDYAAEDPEIMRKYVQGSVDIPKLDKFTAQIYPFRTTRIEKLICHVLETGYVMTKLEHGGTASQSAFVLAFERRARP